MTPMIPMFYQRAREIAAAAPRRTDAAFLAKVEDGVGSIFLYDAVGIDPWTGTGVTAKDIASSLEEMRGAKELRLFVNSPGGSVHEGLAIVAQLDRFSGKVTATVDGVAASAASLIVASADRVVMSRGAMQMIHRAWAGAVGNAADLRVLADALDLHDRQLTEIYAKRTGRPAAEVFALMEAETWMDGQKALDLGFADEIAQEDPPRVSASGTTVAYAAASKLATAGRLAATLSRASAAKG